MKLALQKRTKVVATISDRRCDMEFLQELYELGMNVVRINTAHQTPDSSLRIVENVRKISSKIGILVDTKGPEVRTTKMSNDTGFEVAAGDTVRMLGKPDGLSSSEALYLNYAGFADDVPDGASVLIDDGDIQLKVVGRQQNELLCEVQNGGVIRGRKTVNVPGAHFNLPSLSARDLEYIHWAVDHNLDFIAHSFVRTKDDVLAVQRILDERRSHIKIIAKIENRQGVDNIDEILEHAYGIMVARGDLGVELELEEIPGVQQLLIEKCHTCGKPVIIATQMLHSMIEHPRPTRAEVTDVANAIYQRSDAIMLSGETAGGQYPVEAVRTMSKIAIVVEKDLRSYVGQPNVGIKDKVAVVLAKAAVQASDELPIRAFVTDTFTGRLPRFLAAFRSKVPVYAMCYIDHVIRELSLSYGVYCYAATPFRTNAEFSHFALKFLREQGCLTNADMVTMMAGNYHARGATTYMEIGIVKNLLSEINQEDYRSLEV
ncbi:MAG: pyruvate kinase [Prevotellaceae bacterium]|jgi:pyruvate kinase|nr:pyruvate kinase [Prevotellaceae bacterium]